MGDDGYPGALTLRRMCSALPLLRPISKAPITRETSAMTQPVDAPLWGSGLALHRPALEASIGSDVCIVGAGIAGLNAAFVASQYLGKAGTIVLADRRARVGGMWVDTYDYVRLHQPHPFFTAGNIKWTLGAEPSYLATKAEVLDHFAHCTDVIRARTPLDERYGWDYLAHVEVGGRVETTFERGDERLVVSSTRLIKAFGAQVTPNPPLELSSAEVRSVSPDGCDVRTDEIATDDRPVWIIGGGKTAMDTAHALLSRRPEREVNLLVGSGTFFSSRDKVFPTARR